MNIGNLRCERPLHFPPLFAGAFIESTGDASAKRRWVFAWSQTKPLSDSVCVSGAAPVDVVVDELHYGDEENLD